MTEFGKLTADKRSADFRRFEEHMPGEEQSEDLILLKGHLLVELLLLEFIESKLPNKKWFPEVGLLFAGKSWLARCMVEPEHSDSWIWGALGKLNSLRNAIAHELSPPKYAELREKLIEFVKRSEPTSAHSIDHRTESAWQLQFAIFTIHLELSALLHSTQLPGAGLMGRNFLRRQPLGKV